MINNKELESNLRMLAQFTLVLYSKELPPDTVNQYSIQIINTKLMELDSKVVENPLFNKCIDLMDKDTHIRSLMGRLVGTSEGLSIIQDNNFTILSFLRKLYMSKPSYDYDLFIQSYSSFEELFYSEYLRIRDTSRLNNFESNLPLIELGHGISIKRVPFQFDSDNSPEIIRNWIYANPWISDFIIERLYEEIKLVDNQSILNDSDIELGVEKTEEIFDIIISSLRILKSSAVFREGKIKSELLTFHPQNGGTYTSPLSETIITGEKCIIEEKDISELKHIFNFLFTKDNKRFMVAQRRLFLGNERSELEDRLLDYMIGLEAFYLPDGNQELAFRLSLRMSFLLHTNSEDRKETFNFVKKMYEIRSNIVHGNEYKLYKNQVDKLEELLRKSLKLFLNDKNLFSKEGLSNIFFRP